MLVPQVQKMSGLNIKIKNLTCQILIEILEHRVIHQSDSALTTQIKNDWVETSVYANHKQDANMAIFKQNFRE